MPIPIALRTPLRGVLLLCLCLPLLGCGLLWAVQDRIIFPAPTTPLGDPAALGYDAYHAQRLLTADGVSLDFWSAPAKPGMATVIDFHGNGSRASDSARHLVPLVRRGYGVVLAEYRGYAGNPGSPSEVNLLEDARAYLAWVAANGDPRPVLLGESLGTGVAVAMAAEHPVAGVILDSPYTSFADIMAAGPFRSVPAGLLRNRFDTLARIGRVTAPVLVLRGMSDTVIPPEQGARVFAAAPCPWRMMSLPGVGHLVIASEGSGAVQRVVLGFLQDVAKSTACPQPTGGHARPG